MAASGVTMSSLAIPAARQTCCWHSLNDDSSSSSAAAAGGGGGGGGTCRLSQRSHNWLRQHCSSLAGDGKKAVTLPRQPICALTCHSAARSSGCAEDEEEERGLRTAISHALPRARAPSTRVRLLRTRTPTRATTAESPNEGDTWTGEENDTSSRTETPAVDLQALKAKVLTTIAGLDRGTAASEEDCKRVEEAVKELEAAGGGRINLLSGIARLDGRWRLVFSSGFASGSFGGRRPGPGIGRAPLTLGQVYQDIDVEERKLDNVVELRLGAPWPVPRLELTAILGHSLETTDEGNARIRSTTIKLKPEGALQLIPDLELPSISSFFRAQNLFQSESDKDKSPSRYGTFSVTYLDPEFRISRGDRSELRIFLKV
ncbi:hypothetical protein CBR_g30839 [Chara braunii]|uniref:Plastid lipid-associated protein/fibrillin conserved domain-containing protein n=1 Tax=Chara braunii TaxID=69332 RepID=A0A388JXH8_CHABU|nr:hypothetical protein CBR_g30839 [Chara braunii]|eukprot:GBG62521.1 hypothetical protein CBR_g30839 [Chara braunii]